MCGFAGVLTARSREFVDRSTLDRMQEAIAHRGPDRGHTVLLEEHGLGLAFARLSIIDLTAAGDQPMWNPEKSVGIAYNGETYNFVDLRVELLSLGHVFRSKTDTEVVLNAYLQWGPEMIQRLTGMFAFALVDLRGETSRLLLARDRLGEKPLYYHWDAASQSLVFGSEAKAILEWPRFRRAVSPAALDAYLEIGYVPAPLTMFTGMHKLPAGHRIFAEVGREPRVDRYWKPPSPTARREKPLVPLRDLVERSVVNRMVSDVPLGAFLSGGIDSTIVVGLMSRHSDSPVKTFSAAFEVGPRSPKYNVDAVAARVVAGRYKTEHCPLSVKIEEDPSELLHRVVSHADEPHANPTMLTTFLLCELVKKQGVTVALTGDGSDELFGGYPRYQRDRWVDWLAIAPRFAHGALASLLTRRGRSRDMTGALDKAGLGSETADRYLSWWTVFDQTHRAAIATATNGETSRLSQIVHSLLQQGGPYRNNQEALSYVDLSMWVPDESNMRVDKMSMAHGLECRAPFQDHVLVEAALPIPFSAKVGFPRFTYKRMLREIFDDLLPAEIARRPKWGWFSPVHYWVNDYMWGELSQLVKHLPETGLFTEEVLDLVARHPTTEPAKVWTLAIFSLWHQIFIERSI